eukprot:403359185
MDSFLNYKPHQRRFLQLHSDLKNEENNKDKDQVGSDTTGESISLGKTELTVIVCISAIVFAGLLVIILWKVARCMIRKRKAQQLVQEQQELQANGIQSVIPVNPQQQPDVFLVQDPFARVGARGGLPIIRLQQIQVVNPQQQQQSNSNLSQQLEQEPQVNIRHLRIVNQDGTNERIQRYRESFDQHIERIRAQVLAQHHRIQNMRVPQVQNSGQGNNNQSQQQNENGQNQNQANYLPDIQAHREEQLVWGMHLLQALMREEEVMNNVFNTMFQAHQEQVNDQNSNIHLEVPENRLCDIVNCNTHQVVFGSQYAHSRLSQYSQDSDCIICLQSYKEGDKVSLITLCNHHFHSECIKQWVKRTIEAPTCPLCKVALAH